MTITKTTLPAQSRLTIYPKKYDYIDIYQGFINDPKNRFTAVDVGKAFFSSGPKWIEKLFTVRNKIVSIFGLKTSGNISDRQKQLDNFHCEKGEQLGLFKVFDRTENEVILGEDDKHLNFRVSLLLDEAQIGSSQRALTISTTVEFNNSWGKLYFLPVRPFHKLIVPSMLKGIIKELENRDR